MEELWRPPSREVAEAIRALCQRLLTETESLVNTFIRPTLVAQNDPALLTDASLAKEDRELNRSDLVQWLTANVQHPGLRVEPYIGPRTMAYIHDLVSRGIAPDFAGAWRVALQIGWQRWLEECVAHCTDPDLLVGVLDVSGKSMVQYALDSVSALREAGLAAAMGNADAEAMRSAARAASREANPPRRTRDRPPSGRSDSSEKYQFPCPRHRNRGQPPRAFSKTRLSGTRTA
jgi:hypothetical protein